tara:strand:- start:371 stop:529 length:159 start_codon:yes stop_codon:yes gene_type:complete
MSIHNEQHLLERIKELSILLEGEYLHQIAINTKGESVKRIIIEYENEISESV